jgi:hypothetical protein
MAFYCTAAAAARQLIQLDVRGPLELCYDPEWLAVLRSTHNLYSASKYGARLPDNWAGRRGKERACFGCLKSAYSCRVQQQPKQQVPPHLLQERSQHLAWRCSRLSCHAAIPFATCDTMGRVKDTPTLLARNTAQVSVQQSSQFFSPDVSLGMWHLTPLPST